MCEHKIIGARRHGEHGAPVTDSLLCYRCGHSLETLTLPLGRRDECPSCVAELHVCRMCRHYDPRVPEACLEDDALEVIEKERANFCDYFKPSASAYTPGFNEATDEAKDQLAALFGDSASEGGDSPNSPPSEDDDALSRAEDLFKS